MNEREAYLARLGQFLFQRFGPVLDLGALLSQCLDLLRLSVANVSQIEVLTNCSALASCRPSRTFLFSTSAFSLSDTLNWIVHQYEVREATGFPPFALPRRVLLQVLHSLSRWRPLCSSASRSA